MKAVCSAVVSLLACCAVAGAQAIPAASREPIEVGAAFSLGSPGYQDTTTYVEGLTLFGNAAIHGRLGVQIDVHLDSYITPIDIGENSYLIGPRFVVLREDRVNVYVKGEGGLGSFAYQRGSYANPHSETYGVFAGGAGIEFRATHKLNVRAMDLEFQDWPNFPGGAIHPVVASIGVAWRL